jgi:hypothetical protein
VVGSLASPNCGDIGVMAVTTAKRRIGVEVQNKDQWSWPPDIFFIPAQGAA